LECQGCAIQASPLGQMLQAESTARSKEGLLACLDGSPSRKRAALSQAIMTHSADELRNRAAATALEAYFRLAEAEGRADLLRTSQTVVDEMVATADELEKKGLPSPGDVADLRRRQNDVRADGARVRIAIQQLNAQLRALLGLPCGEPCLLWPADPLRVTPMALDARACVAAGLARRPDLNLLRAVAHGLDKDTLSAVRQMLGGLNAMLGAPAEGPCGLGKLVKCATQCLSGQEVETVRHEVTLLLTERERQATEEIRQAVHEVDARYELVLLMRERVRIAEKKVAELEEKKANGLPVGSDLQTARLEVHKAAEKRLNEVVNWHVARTQLERTMGWLLLGLTPQAIECRPSGAGSL
jgi:outer membrane protein TolC